MNEQKGLLQNALSLKKVTAHPFLIGMDDRHVRLSRLRDAFPFPPAASSFAKLRPRTAYLIERSKMPWNHRPLASCPNRRDRR
jgi:hypothetical protein